MGCGGKGAEHGLLRGGGRKNMKKKGRGAQLLVSLIKFRKKKKNQNVVEGGKEEQSIPKRRWKETEQQWGYKKPEGSI